MSRVGSTRPKLASRRFFQNSCFQTCFRLARVVHIYKTNDYAKITFSVPKYPTKTLGQFLKKLGLEKGLEQRELVKKLRVNKNCVYEWKKDRKKPSGESMEKLAKFFKISRKRLEDLKMEERRLSEACITGSPASLPLKSPV